MLMARGRAKLEWNQTCELWAPLINQIRDTREHPEPYKPSDLNPFFKREEKAMAETHARAKDVILPGTRLRHMTDGRLSN